jgi:hypothetical protein
VRPFVLGAKVSPLGCSRPLQRAIVDFAADQPFAQARAKLEEHYGFAIGESTIQRITFAHAQAMHESSRQDLEFPEAPGLRKPIVVETDGGMVPIVEPSSEEKDKRKGKTLSWREAKLSLAHAQGSCTPVYAGSIEGGVEEAGRQLLSCAVRAGFGANSRVHAVGDGAPWIVGQIEEQFGDQGCYLIDFYHVCEYLGAASAAIAPDPGRTRRLDGDAEGGAQRRASRRRSAGTRRTLRAPRSRRRARARANLPSLPPRSR